MTKEQLHSCMPGAVAIEKYMEPLNAAMEKYEINTPLRQACFIAQIAHESNQLKAVVENLNYSKEGLLKIFSKYFTESTAIAFARQPERIANHVYANRLGNGVEESGDGWRYRGRGLIQLTGKANYQALTKDIGVDFVANPTLLEGPVYASMSAGWFWNKKAINAAADKGDFRRVTLLVNGGYNGFEDRLRYFKLSMDTLEHAS